MGNGIKKTVSGNKGFSLVEIMVVIAIMMILVGMAVLSFNIVSNANVSQAANSLNASFSTARSTSMAKGLDAGTLTIKIIEGKVYTYIGSAADGYAATARQMEKVSTNAISMELAASDNALGGAVLSEGYIKQYSFRPSGAMCIVNYAGGGEPTYTDCTSDSCICYVFKNKKRGSRVFIYPETGRHDVGIWNF